MSVRLHASLDMRWLRRIHDFVWHAAKRSGGIGSLGRLEDGTTIPNEHYLQLHRRIERAVDLGLMLKTGDIGGAQIRRGQRPTQWPPRTYIISSRPQGPSARMVNRMCLL